MNPFRPRLNRLRADRVDRHLGRALRQRLRDVGIPTVGAGSVMGPGLGPVPAPGPDMRVATGVQPLLAALHHVRWLLLHLRHLLVRQRAGMILGAGDNMFVWNRREPSIATGQRGEGDSATDVVEAVGPRP